MQVSAGLAVILAGEGRPRLLLCHPTGAPWRGTYPVAGRILGSAEAAADGTDLALPDVIPPERLQRDEVDRAGLLTREEAEPRIFHRFRPLLDLLERR